ncbi:MAG: hypothetical protein IJU10_04380 [Clostridia bacterium]|nr:hypothetical protein [Clostridia bacterium]
MSRVGSEGSRSKSHGCRNCLIANLVILIVFIAALYIGGSVMFKTYVSPHIGGVTLGEALSLAGKVMFGKEAKRDYGEEDLDNFYTDLSDALFLSEKTEEDYEYELLTEEAKASLAAESVSAGEYDEYDSGSGEESQENKSSYDAAAARERFHALSVAERYALLTDEMKAVVTSADIYGALAADAQADLRASLGLKPYRVSVRSLMEGFTTSDGEFSTDGAAERILTSLDFNFEMLRDYDINDPDAAANTRFNSITLEGKEVSAFINDIVSYMLSTPSSPVYQAMGEKLPADVDLTKYVYVASVTIMNTPLATSGDEAVFNQKDTALGIMFNIKTRDIVLQAMQSPEIANSLSGVPSFVRSIIPKLVPKNFSFGATVYPLAEEADGREIKVRFNKSKDKHAVTLSKIVNGLMNGNKEDGESGEETVETSFFASINNKVVDTFAKINEKVKINFVPSLDSEGKTLKDADGNSYSKMRIMTVETLVSLIDESGELSAHDVFTVLKCLYVTDVNHPALALDAAVNSMKTEFHTKYGVDMNYITIDEGFSAESLNGLLEHMDLKNGVDFSQDNETMRVRLSAEALASIMMKVMTKTTESSGSGEESGESSSSILEGLDPSVSEITITKVANTESVYALEILMSANLSEMILNKFSSGEKNMASTLVPKLLPKGSSYFGMKIYLSEYTEDGSVKHKVGTKISNEENDTTYASKLRINDFDYEETDNVLQVFNKFLTKLGGGSDFDMTSITSSIETAMSDLFESMADKDVSLNLRLFSQDKAAGSNGGFLLPSIYELLSDTVNKKGTAPEPFTPDDAQEVLQLVYKADVDTEKTFADSQSDDFLNEINHKYYIKFDSRLSAKHLFGGEESGEATSLNDTLGSSSIYFKPDNAELTAWREYLGNEEYNKPSLYTDTTPVANMRVALTGSEIAALVVAGGAFPEDMASSFGDVEILGASFVTEGGKTYLKFDLLCTFSKAASEGGEADTLNMNALLPDSMKISAKILLYAPSYPAEEEEGEHRFSSSLLVNDGDSGKIFTLLKAIGGNDLSEQEMSDKLSASLSDIFSSLEKNIRLYYSIGETAYTMTKGDKQENCIYLADVYTALIDTLKIKDEAGEVLTDSADLAARLRSYGEQIKKDPNETEAAYTTWATALDISLFNKDGEGKYTDSKYLSPNIQDAYFMNEAPELDNIYTNVGGEFSSFTDASFRLTDLYHYSGTPRALKISGKALGALILSNTTDSGKFASSVSGESGMSADLIGLKLEYVGGKLKVHAAMKLAFSGDSMMPAYFFVQSVTTETIDGDDRTYETTITINGLDAEETEKFFFNIKSFMGDSVKFDIADIEDTINTSIGDALHNFVSSDNVKVTYGTFDSDDAAYYELALFDDTVTPTVGEGYIEIPNVYSFLADTLFKEDPTKRPSDERDIQHLLNAMYESDESLTEKISVNQKDVPENFYEWTIGLYDQRYNETSSLIYTIYSDTKIAHLLSDALDSESIDGDNISLENGLDQVIILRKVTGADADDSLIRTERAYWATKFGALNDDHNYLVATIKPLFNNYSVTSSGQNLLPTTLWFTVLIDLDGGTASKGLLYNMTATDMTTFENVLEVNGSAFDIDDIAGQLATLINTQMGNLSAYGSENYYSAEDDYKYTPFAPYVEGSASNVKDVINTEAYKCVGYIVFSA